MTQHLITTASKATSTLEGISKLSLDPAVTDTPIALGANDPRIWYQYCGVETLPTLTDNGGGSVTIGDNGVYIVHSSQTATGTVTKHSLNGITQTLTDGVINYIFIDNRTGTPVVAWTTTRTDISDTMLATASPIYTIYRDGSNLHYLNWDSAGVALPEKQLLRTINVHRFERESGLLLSDSGSQHFAISSGYIWYGVNRQSMSAMASNTDTVTKFIYNGSSWVESTVTTFENTYYQGASGEVELTANRYAVTWVYRSMESAKLSFVLLGTGDYKLADAQAAQPPSNVPSIVSALGLLVGKIITLKGSTTASEVDSAFTTTFTPSGTSNHNDLSGRSDADCHPASSITNTPAGPVTATTAQAAIDGFGTIFTDTKWATGFVNRASSTVTLSTRTITVAPAVTSFDIYSAGKKYTKTGGASCQTTIAATNGLHYIYFDNTGTLQNSTSAWTIVSDNIPVCTVFWNGSAGALSEERHGAGRDTRWHEWAHDTIGARYESGLSQTYPSVAQPGRTQIESGLIHDEDIDYSITQQKVVRLWYETAASTWTWVNGTDNGGYDRPYIWNAGTSLLQYPKSDSSYTLTDCAANKYLVIWAYASTDKDRPIYLITASKTAPYSTVVNARAATPPSTVGLLTPEIKLIYRWIFRGDGAYQEGADYRNSSSLPAGGTPTINAISVNYTPTGNISATNVQNAIDELDTEKISGSGGTGYVAYFGSVVGITGSANLTYNSTTGMVIGNTTASTTVTTGALLVAGGMGVTGNINTAGVIKTTNTTASTSTSTGSLIVGGGAGIAGAVWGGNFYTTGNSGLYGLINSFGGNGNASETLLINCKSGGQRVIKYQTASSDRWSLIVFGGTETGSDVGADFGIRSYNDSGTLIDTPLTIIRAAGGLFTTTRPFKTTDTTASSSVTTGALLVAGGVGVTGNINTAGVIKTTNTTASTSTTGGALIIGGGAGIAGQVTASTVQATHKSSDGTTGSTATISFYASSTSGGANNVLNTVTIKDGLITAWTQA